MDIPLNYIEEVMIENGTYIALLDTQRAGYRRHLITQGDYLALKERGLRVTIRNSTVNSMQCPHCQEEQPPITDAIVECCTCNETFKVSTSRVMIKYDTEAVL